MPRQPNRVRSEPIAPTEAKEITDSAETLSRICRSTLNTAFPAFRNKKIEACFYPYIGLTHTIRRKGSEWTIRISDHCRHAPASVLEAVIVMLACKLTGRKPRRDLVQTYERFRKDPRILEMVRKRRLEKGRKRISGDVGKHHVPKEIFEKLNGRYFNNQIEIQKIGWGLRKSWSRLGHYDSVHRTITLSPVLDSPKVPKYVVHYIVYHEMLHVIFDDTRTHGSGSHHSGKFRLTEKSYPDFVKAKRFLRKFCSRRTGWRS